MKIQYFSAGWCSPCRLLKPLFQKVMAANPDVEYEMIDIDDNPDLAQQMNVRSVPTLIFSKDGVVKEVLVGLQKEQALQDTINKWK